MVDLPKKNEKKTCKIVQNVIYYSNSTDAQDIGIYIMCIHNNYNK